jgi:hypothetical protein
MTRQWLWIMGIVFPTLLVAQTGEGPYARIAVLRPHDGKSTEFEAGYIRHLEWHKRAEDPWTWYGYSIWAGDRYRWFVYATFGHSAGSLDSAVTPAEDEKDNLVNVAPYVEWVENGLYEYLPALSDGTGEPQATGRLECTIVDLSPRGGAAAAKAFEAALAGARSRLENETLWYRMVAGGDAPRYVRLRPRRGLSVIINESSEQALPDVVRPLIAKTTVEIWTLRPTMSLGVGMPSRPR